MAKSKNIEDFDFDSRQAPSARNSHDRKMPSNRTMVFIAVIVLVFLAIGWYGYDWYQSGLEADESGQQVNQEKVAKESKNLLDKIKKLIVLPDEEPTIATITDAATLAKQQPFYAGSENGDKLLIFPVAKKAVIYSESKDLLINVGPVYFDAPATTTPETEKILSPGTTD